MFILTANAAVGMFSWAEVCHWLCMMWEAAHSLALEGDAEGVTAAGQVLYDVQ